jgi:signal transduction histidine kinase
MRLGIKGKQVVGVTTIVGAVVVVLSLMHLARLAAVSLEETNARAELLANAIFHRARAVVGAPAEAYQALRADAGLRSVLESSLYSRNVTFAAIVDVDGRAVVHADPSLEGSPVPPGPPLASLLARSSYAQLLAIYSGGGRNFEFAQPLLLGDTRLGDIRIGVSTLLIRRDLDSSLGSAAATALLALAIAVLAAVLLAQIILRPIHVIRSGLTRLGSGELDVHLDLDSQDEFGELGTFFNDVSARLSADRAQMAGQVANLESTVEHMEDAVAIVSPGGKVLFANPAMRLLFPEATPGAALADLTPPDHGLRRLADQTLSSKQSGGPVPAVFQSARGDSGERLLVSHPVNDASGRLMGAMVIARNVEYLSQVQSTLRYSRKLAALGRLSAGVAHEVKNPLNAMMIHLELLRQQVKASLTDGSTGGPSTGAAPQSTAPRGTSAIQHVDVIAAEIRRLDEVVQGFLKFARPEDLRLQPVQLAALMNEVVSIVRPEAEHAGVQLVVQGDGVPDVNGDPAMLRQAFLNLALNACQAMPAGGTLTIQAAAARGRRVLVTVSDTGVGIPPEDLQRVFDLYFTTKQKGSGIGLSMVYRTVQMHDGDIEVQSTPGVGTTFRIMLPQA